MFRSANQPVWVGSSASSSPARHQRKPSPAEPSRYFEHARAEEVDPELADVERQAADRLVAVEEDERAAVVRELGDLGHGQARPVAVADGGDRDERRPLVDQALEVLERDDAVGGRHVDDLGAAQLLGMPDLPDGRELEVADDDPRALGVVEGARERAHPRRERGRHRDLVGLAADEAREGGPGRLGPLDPVLPGCALVVPVGEVGLVGAADRVRERPLRARVDVAEPLEDREALAAACHRARAVNGQGRPGAGRRRRSGRPPSPAGRPGRSRGRSRGRRSRARRWRSARRRAPPPPRR